MFAIFEGVVFEFFLDFHSVDVVGQDINIDLVAGEKVSEFC